MEKAQESDNTVVVSERYTENVQTADTDSSTILGYDSTTSQSVKAFLWYCGRSSDLKTISQLTSSEKKQITNNYLRIFEVLRPIYQAYKIYIQDVIIFSEKTNMYMRYPAKQNNKFDDTIGYDFKQTIYYKNVKNNYINNKKDPTYVQFSTSQEAIYLCIVIEISVDCQNEFCGTACIILKSTFNEFKSWVTNTESLYQKLDKIFILLRGDSIVYTSKTLQDSASSQLLPLSTSLQNIATTYNLKRGQLIINQTKDAWIACNSIDLVYESTQLGSLSQCSISSKYQLKSLFDSMQNRSFSSIYQYPILIYLFNLICAYIIIYYTSINFINPLKDLRFKIQLISQGNLQLILPSIFQHSIREIKDLYEALSFLYDSLRFSDDEFYAEEEDSVVLIRLCSALKHFEKINHLRGIGIANNNIGLVHIQNQRYKEAIKSFKQSLKIVEDKMKQLIKGYTLEQFYSVKPEKGWKYLLDDKYEDEMEEKKDLLIDLENIPESIMKEDTVESFFKQIVNRQDKEKAKPQKKKGGVVENSFGYTNERSNQIEGSSNQKFEKYKTISKSSTQQHNYDIFNGITNNSYSTPKKLFQLTNINSRQKNSQDKNSSFVKQNIQNKKICFSKSVLKRLQKLEPLYINRCNQLANAYCIYVFDIKKTNRKEAKRLAEKAIERYKIVSRLLKNYEHIQTSLKTHFMVIIRLISLYLECADYNKFVEKTEDEGQIEFDKSYDSYKEAQKLLDLYQQGDKRKEDILNQIHQFYIFLYLKGAGLYQDAYERFTECITEHKYYDPAIRYSYLTHVKQILERFNPKIPKSLYDMIEGFKVRKNKDIVFVLNFCKPVDLKMRRKKKQFENVREKMAQVFMKIYEKYIEGDDRISFIQIQKQIDVIFELKHKHNNEKYFKNCIIRNTTIDDSTEVNDNIKEDRSTFNQLDVKNIKDSQKVIDLQSLRDSARNDSLSEQPTFKKLCRSIYTARKLFDKVEDRKNLKWIVVMTDNLDNTVESNEQKLKQIKQLKEYLLEANSPKNENEEQQDLIHLMIIGLNLAKSTKNLFKSLCQVTQEGIFIEDCNKDDIDIAFESISNISHLFGGAAGSTGVSIQDFQNESFQLRKVSDEEYFDIDEENQLLEQ